MAFHAALTLIFVRMLTDLCLVVSATLRITRNTDTSDIHIFTTHFYTTLAEEGPEAVASWTQKKKGSINIFKKKLIFIPSESFLQFHGGNCLHTVFVVPSLTEPFSLFKLSQSTKVCIGPSVLS